MFQEHTHVPCAGDFQAAPSIGHVVSRDLVFWAHLPVAIWNGGPHAYDGDAIYSNAATIVNGVPTIVYPGLCESTDWANQSGHGCSTWPGKGSTLGIARPANLSDPLYTRWVKHEDNPIVNNASCADPSQAWRTKAGEWRFLCAHGTGVYTDGGSNFTRWTKATGSLDSLVPGACPSVFEFPPLVGATPGSRPPATHVSKYSVPTPAFHDVLQPGNLTDGAFGSAGAWVNIGPASTVDGGQLFAGISAWDPVRRRRLYWGWAHDVPPASAITMARSITYDTEIQHFVYSPLEEMQRLEAARGDSAVPSAEVDTCASIR